MKKGKIILTGIVSLALILTFSSFISAGFFDSFKITGDAVSQATNVSATIRGIHPAVVNYVSSISSVNPVELNTVSVAFEVHVFDQDGFNDINKTSVNASFTKLGQTTRTTGNVGSCSYINKIDSRTANFSCSISMQYWDANGAWNISAQGKDIGNGTYAFNSTASFTYNQLKAMVISPSALTWPALDAGATNQLSNNHPTIVNNTGNYNGTVSLNAKDLLGETNSSESITASNFTSSDNVGTVCASGTILVNGTLTTITGTNSNPGNLSAGSSQGQENIYYCMPNVPYVSSQTYSTLTGGSWIVSY